MAVPLNNSNPNIPEGLKEYVQHQIQEMGYRNLTDTELDKYTLEFAKLIVEKPCEDMSLLMSSLSEQSCYSDNQFSMNSTVSDTPPFLKYPAHVEELRLSPIQDHTRPISSHSALYKEILSEADSTTGTIQDISVASLTDISVLDTSLITRAQLKLQSQSRQVVPPSTIPSTTSRAYKRKIANQKHQEKDPDLIPADRLRPITTPNISHINSHSTIDPCETEDGSLVDRSVRDRGKSFIRPNDSALSSYRIHKHDPVSRYHEFSRGWQLRKAPGEKNRNQLRWVIREQLNYQSIPGSDSF